MDDQVLKDVRAFRADGYVKLPNLLPAAELAELQRAYRREQAFWRRVLDDARTNDGHRSPGWFDIPRILEADDSFLKFVCHPRLAALAQTVIGEDVYIEDVRARTVLGLSSQDENTHTAGGKSYTGGFHHDGGEIGFPDHPTLCADAKLFVAVFEQDLKIGTTSVVPGTARIGEGGWGESPHNSDLWKNGVGQDGAHGGGRTPDELDNVAGQIPFIAKAGESLLMDLRCWHTAMPNRTNGHREVSTYSN
eukprot:SAG31_NODE_2102_length_6442_cov_1.702507_3_plen_249_part_00